MAPSDTNSEYRICLMDANAPDLPLVVLPQLHSHLVTHLRWHISGTWLLSADEGGHVVIWRCRVHPPTGRTAQDAKGAPG